MRKFFFFLTLLLFTVSCATQVPQEQINAHNNPEVIVQIQGVQDQENRAGVVQIFQDGVDPAHMRITQDTPVVFYNFIQDTAVVITGPGIDDVLSYRESTSVTLETGEHTFTITPRKDAAGEFRVTVTVV